ncbi:sulfotransferase family protein [Steroidobacter agaridevorans]|uniref:sulfotransferase family protein n=1 Tax=Steroidobacter agaridevorans TaxID=2695856 RepID=UPI00137A9DE7|nr:sulfotransferase [Steroidobacter agaridevorans]
MTETVRKFVGLEDELHEAAIRKTTLDDFGDPSYRRGLEALLHSYDADLRPSEFGWQRLYEGIIGILSSRLHTEQSLAEHPEIISVPIRRPLIITALPRTGTTALHRLLAVDPQFQTLERWLIDWPMVRPPRKNWKDYPAYRDCENWIEAMHAGIPESRKQHELLPDQAEECYGLLMQSFTCRTFALLCPSYADWYATQSASKSYIRYSNILRLIGSAEQNKPWLLKCPIHMTDIDTLLEVFPDACVIQTHRDPARAIPSLCSLQYTARQYLGHPATPDSIGAWQCTFWRFAVDQVQRARQRFPRQFFDVDHRRFVTDPLAVVQSIYEYFGLTLTPHTEQQMRTWIEASPTSRHGRHEYPLDSWGVTQGQICELFADYRAQHHFT